MNIYVSQVYPAAGVMFPFSHVFQKYMSQRLSSMASISPVLSGKYGEAVNVVFNMSAKRDISEPQVVGPAFFRRTGDLEYTIFLPCGPLPHSKESLRRAVEALIQSIVSVFDAFSIDSSDITSHSNEMIRAVMANPDMFIPGQHAS